jgi:hypothetical protein
MPAVSIPAPVGGWNARDALENMAPDDAVELINFVPGNGVVSGRGGSRTIFSGLGSGVDSLIPYEGTTGKKFLGAWGNSIYDITNFAIAPVSLATGFLFAQWQYAAFNNHLALVDGVDPAQVYDGTSLTPMTVTLVATPVNAAFTLGTGTLATGTYWYRVSATNNSGETLASTQTSLAITGPAGVNVNWTKVTGATGYKVYGRSNGTELLIATVGDVATYLDNGSITPAGALPGLNTTGPTPQSLYGVTNFKGRAFYWQFRSTSVWYAAAGSFQGSLTELPLGSVAQRGGYIVQVITWTRDSGDGVDDYCAFIFNTGETLIYQGDDPSNSLRWSMVGRYALGPPVGVRGHARYASTEIIITADGFVGLDEAIQNARSEVIDTFGGKIVSATKKAASIYGTFFGWSATYYPAGNLFLVNVPQSDAIFEQYVKNTNTGSWCRFQGWNARCFGVYDERLYFGTPDGKVVLADVTSEDPDRKAYSDDGNPIQYEALTAYQKFGSPGLKTQLTSARVITNVFDRHAISLNAFADYRTKPLSPVDTPVEQIQGQWDVSNWDEDYWAGDDNDASSFSARPVFRPITAFGFATAMSIRYRSVVQHVVWYSTTFVYKQGGIN